jgi:hypothetical protein
MRSDAQAAGAEEWAAPTSMADPFGGPREHFRKRAVSEVFSIRIGMGLIMRSVDEALLQIVFTFTLHPMGYTLECNTLSGRAWSAFIAGLSDARR